MKISFGTGAYLVFYAWFAFGAVMCWLMEDNPREKMFAFFYSLIFMATYSFFGWAMWRTRR